MLLARTDTAAEPAAPNPLAPKPTALPAKAKNVIFLFMEGAPSQMDLFDPKPALKKWNGKPLPPEMTKDLKLAFIKPTAAVLASPREFQQYGQCGMEFSDFLPHTSPCADDICLVRSMHTDAFNHHPGPVVAVHGLHAIRPADDGRVGHVRTRQRIAEPAGLRRADFGGGDQRRRFELLERLPAVDVRGHAVPQFRRSDSVLS